MKKKSPKENGINTETHLEILIIIKKNRNIFTAQLIENRNIFHRLRFRKWKVQFNSTGKTEAYKNSNGKFSSTANEEVWDHSFFQINKFLI